MPVLRRACRRGPSLVSAIEPGGRPHRVGGLCVGLFNFEVRVQFGEDL